MAPSTNRVKVAGECVVNLSTFCGDHDTRNLALLLQNCPDKKAFIELGIKLLQAEPQCDILRSPRDFAVGSLEGMRSQTCSPGVNGLSSREGSCERILGTTLDMTKGCFTLRTLGNVGLGSAQAEKIGSLDEPNPIKEFNPIKIVTNNENSENKIIRPAALKTNIHSRVNSRALGSFGVPSENLKTARNYSKENVSTKENEMNKTISKNTKESFMSTYASTTINSIKPQIKNAIPVFFKN